jgi:type IV pilus assembly protein PilM
MGSKTNNTLFLRDKPLFGIDIGHNSVKVMQVDHTTLKSPKGARLVGYGSTTFDNSAFKKGTIIKPEIIAKAVQELFAKNLVGDITTRRVAISLPTYRTYSRSIELPHVSEKELKESIYLEIEQYIPVPLDDLYVDYVVTNKTKDLLNIYAVAIPRDIIDSYVLLMEILGLEPVFIETTMGSATRLFDSDKNSDLVSVLIDFGSESSDISIFDKSILVTGTVANGGATFTKLIKDSLGVTEAEAALIKSKYGLNLSKKQKEIQQALEPELHDIVKEIKRMSRYYEERFGNERPISQIITIGGGANMPGLSDYLVSELRMPVRTYDPWQRLNPQNIEPPAQSVRSMYSTVTGLCLCDPREVFVS